MTIEEIAAVRSDIAIQKAAGNSSMAKLRIAVIERLLKTAESAAQMSDVERAASARHMERQRQAGRFAA
jgi:hypothetical protein